MSNTDPIKKRRWTQVLPEGKQFMLLIRYPPRYSYSQDVLEIIIIGETNRLHMDDLSKNVDIKFSAHNAFLE